MTTASMPMTYRALADLRASCAPDGFMQPERFGYDFRDWVSPYTKGARKANGIAVILQDWASEAALTGKRDPRIAELGRDPDRLTNRRLETLLRCVLGVSLQDVYATNVFPFVKPGHMSASIPLALVVRTAKTFTAPELRLAKPSQVLALGKLAQLALHEAGIACVDLPHPAARGLDLAAHERKWRIALDRIVSRNDA